jgi:ABC-type multidrug transport system fused ATPase/permease subunit
MILVGYLGAGVALIYGGQLVLSGDLSAGSFVSYLFYLNLVRDAGNDTFFWYLNFQKIFGSTTAIFETLHRGKIEETARKLREENFEKIYWDATGHVKFQELSFRYPTRPNNFVLKNLNLELKPNTITALVGMSFQWNFQ